MPSEICQFPLQPKYNLWNGSLLILPDTCNVLMLLDHYCNLNVLMLLKAFNLTKSRHYFRIVVGIIEFDMKAA